MTPPPATTGRSWIASRCPPWHIEWWSVVNDGEGQIRYWQGMHLVAASLSRQNVGEHEPRTQVS